MYISTKTRIWILTRKNRKRGPFNVAISSITVAELELGDAAYSKLQILGEEVGRDYEVTDKVFSEWTQTKPNNRVGLYYDNSDKRGLPFTSNFQNRIWDYIIP